MNVFGIVLGVVLCVGLLVYIGFSIFKIVQDIRARREFKKNQQDTIPVDKPDSK